MEEDEIRVLRNHPSVIFRNILTFLIIIVFVMMTSVIPTLEGMSKGGEEVNIDLNLVFLRGILPFIAIIGVILFISYRRWKLTTFTFGPTEITVERNTYFRNEKHIQYSKLASVNVRRGIICQITGTTDLLFNVNSSVNSMSAEATLTLKAAEADALREAISSMIFRQEFEVVKDRKESLVSVSNIEIVLHGLFGQPSISSIVGIGFGVYTVASTVLGGFGSIFSFIMFVFTTLFPWVKTIFRYANYSIYRDGDTITVESGLITTYRSSFSIKKINSVTIRQPLLARIIGKSLLEAEVVGLANNDGKPLLCPLKSTKIVDRLANELIPEFLQVSEKSSQPREAFLPTMLNRMIFSAITIIAGPLVWFLARPNAADDIDRWILTGFAAVLCIGIPVTLILHGLMAHRKREFGMGQDVLMFTIGAFDLETDMILYDKIQISTVSSGFIQRRFGMAQCITSVMSAAGKKTITSGVFSKEVLAKVSERVMERIRNGEYDYRRYL